jgi:hypothetical protein
MLISAAVLRAAEAAAASGTAVKPVLIPGQ